jgi:IS4 transposase
MARKPLPKLYLEEIVEAMEDLLPAEFWLKFHQHGNLQWTPARLVMCSVLLGWDDAQTLTERFENARELLRRIFGDWQPAKAYNAYADALKRWLPQLFPLIRSRLQQRIIDRCQRFWKTGKWVVFAADGSRFECPRTLANEAGLKCAGKNKTAPQVFHTMLIHLETATLWDFRTGPGTDSERRHLQAMLEGLPEHSLVVTDAGFIGWELCQSFRALGRNFLLRVGSNVTLLAEQFEAEVQQVDRTVWLWPKREQDRGQPPLVLRLLVFGTGKEAVYLVTDVLDEAELPAALAEQLYRQRWGIEVSYRSIKQVLDRGQWLSRIPARVLAEHTATIQAIWILQVLSIQELVKQPEQLPRRWSPARARNIIRRVLRRALDPTLRPRDSFRSELGRAVQDCYRRRGPKKARDWPHKKREKPPGPPRIEELTEPTRKRGQHFLDLRV